MGLAYNVYLNSDRIFGCKNCKAHLATYEAIISRVSRSIECNTRLSGMPRGSRTSLVAPIEVFQLLTVWPCRTFVDNTAKHISSPMW